MTITPTATGYSAFQRCVDGKKVGFVCDAENIQSALNGCVQMIAAHCTTTGTHPAKIITGVEHK